jgi:hypothetical protein
MGNNLIGEFFYEGISKLIPGFIIIGLYKNLFFKLKDDVTFYIIQTPTIRIFFYFLAAWFIGTVIEAISFQPLLLFVWSINSCLSKLLKWLECMPCQKCFLYKITSNLTKFVIQQTSEQDSKRKESPNFKSFLLPKGPYFPEDERNRRITKIFAETTLFRCLTLISLTTIFYNKIDGNKSTYLTPSHGICATIVFFVIWLIFKYSCKKSVEEMPAQERVNPPVN